MRKKKGDSITAKDLERWRSEGAEILRKQEEERQKAFQTKVEGICVVCRTTTVVAKTRREFDASMGPLIIGPGSKSQYRLVHDGYHCTTCGLKYEFPVKEYGGVTVS